VSEVFEAREALERLFADRFGAPPPAGMLPDKPLRRLGEDSLMFGTEPALGFGALVLQAEIGRFLEQAPEGYLLLGFWGYGVQSYAFYYARVDAWSRVYFRLPYGGVYMDNERAAARIRTFLKGFFAAEPALRARAASFVAVESMDAARYRAVGKDGSICELDHSLVQDPSFERAFAPVLGGS